MGKRTSYTDVVLTVIALLLALNVLQGLGWLGARPVHGSISSGTPVQIVGVEKALPVSIVSPRANLLTKGDVIPGSIEAPLSITGSLCANPCR